MDIVRSLGRPRCSLGRAPIALATAACLVASPLLATQALASQPAPVPVQPADPEPRFQGVGLMVGGALLGTVAVYPAFLGGVSWLFAGGEPTHPDSSLDPIDPHFEDRSKKMFLIGSAGLVLSGVMIIGGVLLQQRHLRWKRRRSLAFRLSPSYQRRGQTHALGVMGRF